MTVFTYIAASVWFTPSIITYGCIYIHRCFRDMHPASGTWQTSHDIALHVSDWYMIHRCFKSMPVKSIICSTEHSVVLRSSASVCLSTLFLQCIISSMHRLWKVICYIIMPLGVAYWREMTLTNCFEVKIGNNLEMF